MISAVSWVPKGVSKAVPSSAEPPSKEEVESLKGRALQSQGGNDIEDDDDANMDIDGTKKIDQVSHALAAANAVGNTTNISISGTSSQDMFDGLRELNMDHYDDEDDGIELFSTGLGETYYPSNDMDPYLKNKDDYDSEEIEDMIIKPTDSVVICARNEDEVNHLEVWIIEELDDADSNKYIHHDIIISAFPLCTAWLDCPIKGGDNGNFLAVGSMEPAIEIWDLDIIDELQPCMILGGISDKKKKGKKKTVKYKKDSHTDSVLGLAWNKEFRNTVASASADKLVKIWDVATGKCNITMEHHTDKVILKALSLRNTCLVTP